jgi:proteasome lid subunit RPN8/RPN11
MIDYTSILDDIRGHVSSVYPEEACGIAIVFKGKLKYVPCNNIAANKTQNFIMDPNSWVYAEDMGTPVLIVHSHPNIPPNPSQADRVSCERSGLPWLIINWPVGNTHYLEPTGYVAPLEGRQFSHGILDCFTIIQDYYKEVLGISLDTPVREENWWSKGHNLYLDNAEAWGFIKVDKPKKHDILLMNIYSNVPNHGAIWVEDGLILHHQTNRLSSKDVYGGYYQKVTTHFFRHKDLL